VTIRESNYTDEKGGMEKGWGEKKDPREGSCISPKQPAYNKNNMAKPPFWISNGRGNREVGGIK